MYQGCRKAVSHYLGKLATGQQAGQMLHWVVRNTHQTQDNSQVIHREDNSKKPIIF